MLSFRVRVCSPASHIPIIAFRLLSLCPPTTLSLLTVYVLIAKRSCEYTDNTISRAMLHLLLYISFTISLGSDNTITANANFKGDVKLALLSIGIPTFG